MLQRRSVLIYHELSILVAIPPARHHPDAASLEILADLFDVMKISTPITVEWHDPAVQMRQDQPVDTGLMSGQSRFELSTCDGATWTGFHTYSIAGTVQGGTMGMSGNIPLTFELQPGASTAETSFSGTSTMTADVSDANVSNDIELTGTAVFELDPETGIGKVTLKIEGGSQDILVVAPGFSGSGAGGIEADEKEFEAPLTSNESCSD
jgi:hypothetical protein